MERREPGEDCVGFRQRMGCKDQVFTIAEAALHFGAGAGMVFVPSADRGDETTRVKEIPAQSGGPRRGSAITDHVHRALDRRRLQDRLILARNGDDKRATLLKCDFKWNRLDLHGSGNDPKSDSGTRFQPRRVSNCLGNHDTASFVYG